jgi:pyridoxal phosphate enzyme (YggS family)
VTASTASNGSVAANLEEIRERIASAATTAGRDPADVTLVVVTKTVPEARVREALAAGARDLGENRAQELVAKADSLREAVLGEAAHAGGPAADALLPRWHFIGRLQRNKVRMLAPHVDLWHSIDRSELADPLARYAPGARVLVEVNLSDEPQKGGCRPQEAPALVEGLAGAGLVVEGLMTVPAAVGDPRPAFAALRDLAGRLGLSQLSMGMTSDFEPAVAEGATIVRVGSAVFGPRPGPTGLRR